MQLPPGENVLVGDQKAFLINQILQREAAISAESANAQRLQEQRRAQANLDMQRVAAVEDRFLGPQIFRDPIRQGDEDTIETYPPQPKRQPPSQAFTGALNNALREERRKQEIERERQKRMLDYTVPPGGRVVGVRVARLPPFIPEDEIPHYHPEPTMAQLMPRVVGPPARVKEWQALTTASPLHPPPPPGVNNVYPLDPPPLDMARVDWTRYQAPYREFPWYGYADWVQGRSFPPVMMRCDLEAVTDADGEGYWTEVWRTPLWQPPAQAQPGRFERAAANICSKIFPY